MERPNILILQTDQQRWDALGANGNREIHTPNLDALAREAVNFDHCFVQSPVCMPSRISFLSGQYPSTLGITHMGVPVPEETVTLPRLLGLYGYRRALLGKLHFLPHANRDHRRPHPAYGFDQLEVADEPGVYEDAYRAWVRRTAPDQLPHLSVGLPPATQIWYRTMNLDDPVPHPHNDGQGNGRFDFKGAIPFPGDDGVTHSAFVADRTMAFLRRQRDDQPFFCMAGFYSPHAPWVVPQRYLDQYEPADFNLPDFPPEQEAQRAAVGMTDAQLRSARHGYYAMVTEVDAYVGRILETLEEEGLADNTVVVFTSDHGEWLGEGLRYGKGYPGDDAVSRVPLLVRAPGLTGGRTHTGLVEALDLLPTLLDLAGIQPPPHLQGQSLWPHLQGPGGAERASALTEYAGWKSLRLPGRRYLLHQDGREAFYDLAAPFGAQRDVAAQPAYTADLAAARHALLTHLLAAERPLPRIWPY